MHMGRCAVRTRCSTVKSRKEIVRLWTALPLVCRRNHAKVSCSALNLCTQSFHARRVTTIAETTQFDSTPWTEVTQ